jgi:hypothetical protein
VRYVPDGSLCTASAKEIFPRDSVQRNCFELALYTTRDHDCISNRIGSGIRNYPRCRCRLATFGAPPTPSMINRAIIMLNDHRFRGHASGPSSSGKTLPSVHPLLARPCCSPQRPRCSTCGEQPKFTTNMLDPRTGRTFHMFDCQCGNRTWISEKAV